jgi:hypothetical protein
MMEIQSAFNSGVQGLQKAAESANQAASDIARSTSYQSDNVQEDNNLTANENTKTESLPNLTQSIVDLKVAEHQTKASANVVKTADEALGTLLDVSV